MDFSTPTGRIITFYSYKGGTGRSMALANIACLLARRAASDRPVLVIDWDLEAPGLHRYFAKYLPDATSRNLDAKKVANISPGLIDLFVEIDRGLDMGEISAKEEPENLMNIIQRVNPQHYILKLNIPNLHLLKAGAFDISYSERVNSFNWKALFQKSPGSFVAFAEYLTHRYSYVLIDSRTGHTDISGICTMLLPERLVTVFTPNQQSLQGLSDIVQEATEYRRQSEDIRKLVIFPLPSRIENAEPELREKWRFGEPSEEIEGYQTLFEDLFKGVYGLASCNLEDYFDEIQIQHVPRFAYGEEIAILTERSSQRLSLTRSYEAFCERLINSPSPWEFPVKESEKLKKSVSTITATLERQAERSLADGDYESAADLLKQIVGIHRENIETQSDHKDLINSLNRFADALLHLGRYAEALSLVREAYDLLKFDDDHDMMIDTMRNLGIIYSHLGQYDKAQAITLERYHLLRENKQENQAEILNVLNDLASIDFAQGSLELALARLQEAEHLAKDFGDSRYVGLITANMGRLMARANQLDESIEYFQRAIQLYQEQGEEYSPQFAQLLGNMAQVYVQQGQIKEAEKLLLEALPLLEKTFGPAHPLLANNLSELGGIYLSLGRKKEARLMLERSLSIQERALGRDNPKVVNSLLRLAYIAATDNQPEEAEDLFSHAMRAAEGSSNLDLGSDSELEKIKQIFTQYINAAWVNSAVNEYQDIMAMVDEASKPIEPLQIHQFHTKLQAFKTRLSIINKKVQDEQERKTIAQLESTVNGLLRELGDFPDV